MTEENQGPINSPPQFQPNPDPGWPAPVPPLAGAPATRDQTVVVSEESAGYGASSQPAPPTQPDQGSLTQPAPSTQPDQPSISAPATPNAPAQPAPTDVSSQPTLSPASQPPRSPSPYDAQPSSSKAEATPLIPLSSDQEEAKDTHIATLPVQIANGSTVTAGIFPDGTVKLIDVS